MIPRYSRPEMSAIWTEQAKYQRWLEVEIAVCEARAKTGEIPKDMETLTGSNPLIIAFNKSLNDFNKFIILFSSNLDTLGSIIIRPSIGDLLTFIKSCLYVKN